MARFAEPFTKTRGKSITIYCVCGGIVINRACSAKGEEQEFIRASGVLSWYDTRKNQLHGSSEWCLYYQDNAVTELMDEGDRLFVARWPGDTVLFIVVPGGSTIANPAVMISLASQAQALTCLWRRRLQTMAMRFLILWPV